MKIVIADEATNPGNIGGYKNTPFTGKRPVWNRNHQREPGSNRDWHDKDMITEGFLDDLVSLATDNSSNDKNADKRLATDTFEKAIEPHTAEELYKAVCFMLAERVHNERVNKAAKLFLPVKSNYVSDPKSVDSEIFEDYKDKIEDAVIEYCTTDALDILDRIRRQYGNNKEITGEVNYGTILSKVDTDEYDLVSKVAQLYDEFEAEVGPIEDEDVPKRSASSPLDKTLKSVQRLFPDLDEDTVIRLIDYLATSDIGIGLMKDYMRRSK